MVSELKTALKHLDQRLDQAIAAAADLYGVAPGQDPYRGLYVSPNDVDGLLERPPLVPLFPQSGGAAEVPPGPTIPAAQSRLRTLQQWFDLTDFDIDLVVIALAPEIEPRYERLYAYLQDDVQCRRPSVNLALDLLCQSAADKLARRAHLSATAPLLSHGLLHLIPNSNQVSPGLLGQFLALHSQVVNFLVGQESLVAPLAPFCRCYSDHEPVEDAAVGASLDVPSLLAMAQIAPQKLYFCGSQPLAQLQTARAIAAALKRPLLAVNLAQLLSETAAEQLRNCLTTLALTLRLGEAVFYGYALNQGWLERSGLLEQLLHSASIAQPVTVLSGAVSPPAALTADWLRVGFAPPSFSQRRSLWQRSLFPDHLAAPSAVSDADLDALANRFVLSAGQIQAAATQACRQAEARAAQQSPAGKAVVTAKEAFAAARAQSSQDLTALTQKIQPVHHWRHLVLPSDTLQQLRELCAQVHHRHRVFDQWGYGQRLSSGKGLNALFSGPPGTGKTTAAEAIARELQLDLYKIDLSQMVSKYIGETEKNLDRIFTAATAANAILLFDEADALFGKRSEVRDAHDRYANIEVSYLLQKMEGHDGISILTTNLRQNLDEAFVRRLAFIVPFPAPDEAHRRKIWDCLWPAATPLAADVDFDWLARQFKLSGGSIKNIALAAAFLAAETDGPITMGHLLQAVRREYQKMGQTLSTAQLTYGNPKAE